MPVASTLYEEKTFLVSTHEVSSGVHVSNKLFLKWVSLTPLSGYGPVCQAFSIKWLESSAFPRKKNEKNPVFWLLLSKMYYKICITSTGDNERPEKRIICSDVYFADVG